MNFFVKLDLINHAEGIGKMVGGLLHLFRRPLSISRTFMTKEKWKYNDEDISNIVKHMQEIVLLKSTQQSVMEQVCHGLQ